MKLYYSPGTCSLAIHILLREIGADFEIERVDTAAATTATGADFKAINIKGVVPVITLDEGGYLSEGPIIAQYLADMAGRTDLMPAAGTRERYRVMEWQNYITADLHKGYGPLFKPQVDDPSKDYFRQVLRQRYEWLNSVLADREHLTGPDFTAADAYLFVVTNWAALVKLELSDLAHLQRYQQRIAQRETVRAAMQAEGLIKG